MICDVCGTEYEHKGIGPKGRTCSDKCKQIMEAEYQRQYYLNVVKKKRKAARKKVKKTERICKYCEKPFMGTGKMKFCSKEHKVRYWREIYKKRLDNK